MKCYNHADVEAIGVCTACGKMICKDCALDINGKLVCKSCAENNAASSTVAAGKPRKELVIALLLSFIIPGAGQLYNGQVKKGLTILVGYYIFAFTAIVLCFLIIGVCLLPFLIGFQIYNIYDAVVTAEKINRGECVGDWFG